MKNTLLALLLLPVVMTAQQGIKFEHGLTWSQIQVKAKAENKFIFLDAFTTWCVPCRYMADSIFTTKTAGDFFNKTFISVAVQLDTTVNDNEEVKSWHADGNNIAKQYKIDALPTYLFFDPNGKIVHRMVGGSNLGRFIATASDALDSTRQYYTLLNQYQSGNRDPDFLKRAARAAFASYDRESMSEISKQYISTQKDLSTNDNLAFLAEVTFSSKDPGFDIILKNETKYDAVNGSGSAHGKIIDIIKAENIYPVLGAGNNSPDWSGIKADLSKIYPKYSDEVVLAGQVIFYEDNKKWPEFQTAIIAYMKDYGSKLSPGELNNFAWTVFLNCKDTACLKEALDWSRRSIKDQEEPMFIDTYANLMYKLGKKQEAIKWEEKAYVLSNKDKAYLETLDKMKRGENTWQE